MLNQAFKRNYEIFRIVFGKKSLKMKKYRLDR